MLKMMSGNYARPELRGKGESRGFKGFSPFQR